MADIQSFLNNTIAMSEAVLLDAEKRKLHEPTVEFFRGKKILAEQILAMLEGNQPETDEILHAEIVNGQIRVYNTDGEPAEIVIGYDGIEIR